MTDAENIEALRAAWLDLMRRRLPEAARDRPDWPVKADHCFARIILDYVAGRPWREVVPSPAWRHLDGDALGEAIALGEAVLAGRADLDHLNRRSLQLRGKLGAARSAA